MWVLLGLPRFGGAIHANGHDQKPPQKRTKSNILHRRKAPSRFDRHFSARRYNGRNLSAGVSKNTIARHGPSMAQLTNRPL